MSKAIKKPATEVVDLDRLVRPSIEAYWWWLPECFANQGKGSNHRYWSVVKCGPDTEMVGEFVGPLVAPVWPNDQGESQPHEQPKEKDHV